MKSAKCKFVNQWRCTWVSVIWLLIVFGSAWAGDVRVVATGDDWVDVVVDASDFEVVSGSQFDRVNVPGWMSLHQVGAPAVPVRGAVLGMPFGSRAVATVVEADYEEIADVNLMPVPDTQWLGSEDYPFSREVYGRDEAVYGRSGFYPGVGAVITHTGTLRDQQVVALSLRPVQYDPVRRVLQVAKQLRVRVQFVPGATRPAVRALGVESQGAFEPVYQKGLLNANQARSWRGRRVGGAAKQASDWYDPTATYYKIRISEDGFYRLDADWFAASDISLAAGDLERLQVFLNGEEVPLLIEDGGDGVLDVGDGVMFWGTFRRALDRDFENDFVTIVFSLPIAQACSGNPLAPS